MIKEIKTNNDLETIELGIKLGKLIKNNNLTILLNGNLAAGKTTFTKGIAKGLGINKIVKSPTFTILRIYEEEDIKLYHLDLYRLNNLGLDFDLEEYIDRKDGITVIEWPEQVSELIPKDYIKVDILNDITSRTFKFSTDKYKEVLEKL